MRAPSGTVDIAPVTTLHMMRLHAPQDALPYLFYVGVFVLSVGIACLLSAVTQFCLSACGSCSPQDRHLFAICGSEESAQKIKFVFSASPEMN
jgi:hypothetical protein